MGRLGGGVTDRGGWALWADWAAVSVSAVASPIVDNFGRIGRRIGRRHLFQWRRHQLWTMCAVGRLDFGDPSNVQRMHSLGSLGGPSNIQRMHSLGCLGGPTNIQRMHSVGRLGRPHQRSDLESPRKNWSHNEIFQIRMFTMPCSVIY